MLDELEAELKELESADPRLAELRAKLDTREAEWIAEVTEAFRLDMQQMAHEGRALAGWLDLVVFASHQGRRSALLEPIRQEILAVNALLSYVEQLRWAVPDV